MLDAQSAKRSFPLRTVADHEKGLAMIHFKCPKCGDFISVQDSCAGQTATCPGCGNISVAPPAEEVPEQSAAGAPPVLPKDPEKEARMWGMLCHLAGLAMFLVPPVGGIIGPLIVWLVKKDQHPFIDTQGKAALNFQISVAIYGIVCFFLAFLFIGILLLPALGIFTLVMIIMAAIKANEGESFRYPLTIRFLK